MRYVEAFPDELDAAWERGAPAVVPIGALEWHGRHLPLGVDGILAESFASSLAEATAGILLPTFYTPITTLPHRHSLQVTTECFRLLMDEMISGLVRSGARDIAIVTGHYAQGHELELYEVALRAMEDHESVRVFAATPLEALESDELLDHAGRYETSQMQWIRADLVRLSAFSDHDTTIDNAVLGRSPLESSPSEGEQLIAQALEAWIRWLQSPAENLREHYGRRFDAYQPYVDTYYRGSWEEAILSWWAAESSSDKVP